MVRTLLDSTRRRASPDVSYAQSTWTILTIQSSNALQAQPRPRFVGCLGEFREDSIEGARSS
jgi:hypothetical protein